MGMRDGRLQLLPLPPPSILGCAVQVRVLCQLKRDTNAWSTWQFWRSFANDPQDMAEIADWFAVSGYHGLENGDGSATDWTGTAWMNFVTAIKGKRELILYAQRAALLEWFPLHDPTSPERLEDTDRPWDFDHILPNAFRSAHHVPDALREWQASTGNMRAWPAELNRSDGATRPEDKLSKPGDREATVYGLHCRDDILEKSAITEEEYRLWCEACPDGVQSNYLAQREHASMHLKLLQAITARWVRLYETWFNELRLRDLTGVGPNAPE